MEKPGLNPASPCHAQPGPSWGAAQMHGVGTSHPAATSGPVTPCLRTGVCKGPWGMMQPWQCGQKSKQKIHEGTLFRIVISVGWMGFLLSVFIYVSIALVYTELFLCGVTHSPSFHQLHFQSRSLCFSPPGRVAKDLLSPVHAKGHAVMQRQSWVAWDFVCLFVCFIQYWFAAVFYKAFLLPFSASGCPRPQYKQFLCHSSLVFHWHCCIAPKKNLQEISWTPTDLWPHDIMAFPLSAYLCNCFL